MFKKLMGGTDGYGVTYLLFHKPVDYVDGRVLW